MLHCRFKHLNTKFVKIASIKVIKIAMLSASRFGHTGLGGRANYGCLTTPNIQKCCNNAKLQRNSLAGQNRSSYNGNKQKLGHDHDNTRGHQIPGWWQGRDNHLLLTWQLLLLSCDQLRYLLEMMIGDDWANQQQHSTKESKYQINYNQLLRVLQCDILTLWHTTL